ncbi:DUF2157 domain-containing protein [Egbenema bharatensis]|uniref:DUF2157 domain-containing protein n=1 Tax=Egbenema bharatensis TaxID=3463334 RepID=UPI003A870987
MVTETFRRQLRHESEQWWTEGLITSEFYQTLVDRYQLDALERDASNRFVAILMGLGGILLGLGIITFVAANWQDWTRSFRVILLLSLFISVNVTGFFLWRRPAHKPGLQKLGHGLLLLGALILGANLALLSQMFHQSGNFYELLLVWSLGVLAMACSLRLTSLGIMSLLLMGWGYFAGWIVWSSAFSTSPWQGFIQHMPLAVSVLFIPLSYWCRSRVLFGLSAILISVAIVFNLRPLTGWGYGNPLMPGWIAAIAFVLPPALLWVYHRHIFTFRKPTTQRRSTPHPSRPIDPFQPIARSLSLWFLSLLFYFFSFHWFWNTNGTNNGQSYEWITVPLLDAIVLSLVAAIGWLKTAQHPRRSGWFQEKAVNTGVIAVVLVITAALFTTHLEGNGLPGVAPLGFNIMLFGLAIALIRDGLALTSRSTFWGGDGLTRCQHHEPNAGIQHGFAAEIDRLYSVRSRCNHRRTLV